eukprot:m.6021 g.6021  ORF g.6021 m.6021 type:complete len:71 (-) comp3468_c0_seq1:423-635(-)
MSNPWTWAIGCERHDIGYTKEKVYEGEVKEGLPNGWGVELDSKSTSYGQWAGVKHGKHVCKEHSGDIPLL